MKKLLLNIDQFNGPIYLKIVKAIEELIHKNKLVSGNTLPSIRQLADNLGCHRHTVMTAYQELVSQGYVDSFERASYRVSNNNFENKLLLSKNKGTPKIIPINENLNKKLNLINFGTSLPDERHFPIKEYKSYLVDALNRKKASIFTYQDPSGLTSYKRAIGQYLNNQRDIQLETEDNILVTHGSQEALYIALTTLLKPNDYIMVEKWCYRRILEIIKNTGAHILPINVEKDGLDIKNLHIYLKKYKVKAIYTNPLHQYPTTVTMSWEKRLELLKLANMFNFYILEDDYDHEFHYRSRPLRPLCSIDANQSVQRVIYFATLSKILFPGVRLGHMVVPSNLYAEFKNKKYMISDQNDGLHQEAIATWMQEGGFERHIRKMKRIYKERYLFFEQLLLEAKREGLAIDWHDPRGGMAYWVKFPMTSQQIVLKAAKSGLKLFPESHFNVEGKEGSHLRLGFTQFNCEELRKNFKLLRDCLE